MYGTLGDPPEAAAGEGRGDGGAVPGCLTEECECCVSAELALVKS